MAPFDVATVRRYAREYGWKEVQHNVASAVLGFARGDQRCNVYYTTGVWRGWLLVWAMRRLEAAV